MKKLFLLTALLMLSAIVFAQQKSVVKVDPFLHSSNISEADSYAIRSKIIDVLTRTGRVEIIDPNLQKNINAARDRNKSESAMDAAMITGQEVATVIDKPIDMILTGTVESMSSAQESYTDILSGSEKRYVKCTINYSLQFADPNNGSVISSKSFTAEGTSYECNAADAKKDAIDKCGKAADVYIQEIFPISGSIVAIESAKGNKAATVYIDLGSDIGLKEGDKYDVCQVFEVAGSPVSKQIGSITIKEVLSGNRSLCKVTKGGDVIYQLLQKGEKLPVQSVAKAQGSGLLNTLLQ